MNEKCKNCKHLGMRLPCTICLWNNDFYEPLAPPSPPEMPEVDPHLTLGENGTTPQVLGYCVRFKVKRGKKEANSCVGCTVGCPGKGKQEPTKCTPDTCKLECDKYDDCALRARWIRGDLSD